MYMDKRKLLLLKYLLNNCDNGYKVLEVSKIFDKLRKYKSDFQLLQEDINVLKQYKYVDVKYIDEINLCLAVLDNTRIFQENLRIQRGTSRGYWLSLTMNMIVSGVMAFLGAFLAIILIR